MSVCLLIAIEKESLAYVCLHGFASHLRITYCYLPGSLILFKLVRVCVQFKVKHGKPGEKINTKWKEGILLELNTHTNTNRV